MNKEKIGEFSANLLFVGIGAVLTLLVRLLVVALWNFILAATFGFYQFPWWDIPGAIIGGIAFALFTDNISKQQPYRRVTI